jgi:hypothetical protein
MLNFNSIEDLVDYAESKYNVKCSKVKANLYTAEIELQTLGLFGRLVERAYITINYRKESVWSIGFRWKVKDREKFDSKALEDRFGDYHVVS